MGNNTSSQFFNNLNAGGNNSTVGSVTDNNLTPQQRCTNYYNNLQSWLNITIWGLIVIIVLFIIAVIGHIAISNCSYENESKYNLFVQILNIIFWIFIALFIILSIFSVVNWVLFKEWLNNANNQNAFISNCENIVQNWQNGSINSDTLASSISNVANNVLNNKTQ